MATSLDLEEQEQLETLKHFWNTYGNLITAIVTVAAVAFLAWTGWQYYARKQAAQASALYNEMEYSVRAGNVERTERVLADMKEHYARTAYAQQAGLLAAKLLEEKGKSDAARAALGWVAEKANDTGYRAIARLRLSAVLLDAKAYDQALAQLAGEFPREFEPLVADRKGDIYMAQGKRDSARDEYQKAWNGLGSESEYRRLVEIKLNAAGVAVQNPKAPPAPAPNNS